MIKNGIPNLVVSFFLFIFVLSKTYTMKKNLEYSDMPDKKAEVKMNFINLLMNMGMDRPSNFDEILDFIYDDVCETADEKNWSVGDVVIGFRRWIEAQAEK